MKRTDEQKQAFVQQCLEIEKAGGDVLGYIEVNWPSYTPRATWYNLQKQFLCRRQWQLTEGKPKGGESMSKMLEVAQKAMEAVDAGENVFDYLEKAGYKNPSSTWYMLKQHAKKHDQDLYERMAAVAVGRRKPNPAPAKAKPVETPVISPGQQIQMQELKPDIEDPENGPTFDELLKINPKLVIVHVSGMGHKEFGGIPSTCSKALLTDLLRTQHPEGCGGAGRAAGVCGEEPDQRRMAPVRRGRLCASDLGRPDYASGTEPGPAG